MNFKEYQDIAKTTAIYKDKVIYSALGLASEAGEVCGKVKKLLRDDDGIANMTETQKEALAKEVGDVVWYVAAIATDLGKDLNEIADGNIKKLLDRKDRGVLGGSGDNR